MRSSPGIRRAHHGPKLTVVISTESAYMYSKIINLEKGSVWSAPTQILHHFASQQRLQDDLLPPATTTRERACSRSRTPTAAQPPSMARLQRLEIGRGRLIDLCRAGCPIPPHHAKARSRAAGEGARLTPRRVSSAGKSPAALKIGGPVQSAV